MERLKTEFENVMDLVSPFMGLFSLAFCYAGFVNQGMFSFFPSIPFFCVIIYLIYRYKSWLIKAAIIGSLIPGISKQIEKSEVSNIFHPVVGKSIKTIKPICVQKYKYEDKVHVKFSKFDKDNACTFVSTAGATLIEYRLVPKNTIYKVLEVEYWGGLITEDWQIVVMTELGKVSLFDIESVGDYADFVFEDDSKITKSDIIDSSFRKYSRMLFFIFLWPSYLLLGVYFHNVIKEIKLKKDLDS